jgi:hypothetical protein
MWIELIVNKQKKNHSVILITYTEVQIIVKVQLITGFNTT